MTAKESVKQKVKAEYGAAVEEYKKNENYLNPRKALDFGIEGLFAEEILSGRLSTLAYEILDREAGEEILEEMYTYYVYNSGDLELGFTSRDDARKLINLYLSVFDESFLDDDID